MRDIRSKIDQKKFFNLFLIFAILNVYHHLKVSTHIGNGSWKCGEHENMINVTTMFQFTVKLHSLDINFRDTFRNLSNSYDGAF